MPKYLFLQRSVPGKSPQPPSPAQMQEMFAAFNAWKEKFKDNIVDMGGKLRPGGTVVTTSGATDGPFVEAKEVVGGYMLVSAESPRARTRGRARKPGRDDAGLERRGPGDPGDATVLTSELAPGHPGATTAPGLVEHFFRHEYGRLVALLTRKVGVGISARVEDAVQGALMTALDGLDGSRHSRRSGCVALPRRLATI